MNQKIDQPTRFNVATIVLCLGKVLETNQCLQSLIEYGYPGNKILVVENGTSDNVSTLGSDFPSVRFLVLPQNEGFTGGFNRGIKEAESLWNPDYYFLINNDARVSKGTIAALVKILEKNPNCGLAAPKILVDEQEKIFWAAGGEFIPWRFMARNRGMGIKDTCQFDQIEISPFLSGCALIIRNEVVKTVGLFDERFFVYSEDLDYCLRVRAGGWQLIYCPDAIVFHKGSVTAGGEYGAFQSFYRWRNRFLIISKHAASLKKIALFTFFMPPLMIRDMVKYFLRKETKSIVYLWKGFFDFLSIWLLNRTPQPLRTKTVCSDYQKTIKRLHCGYLAQNPILILLLKIIDFFGSLIFGYRSRRLVPKNPSKILIAKIDHLGDVLMSLYILPEVKRTFPRCKIHYVCGSWAQPIVQNNPLLDRILTFDHFRLNRSGALIQRWIKMVLDFFAVVREIRQEQYDLALDLRAYFPNFLPVLAFGNIRCKMGYATGGFGFLLDVQVPWREGVHETEHFFDLLKMVMNAPKREKLELSYLFSSQRDKNILDGLDINNIHPLVLIHAFCRKSGLATLKHWRMKEWKKVIRFLGDKGFVVVCTGDGDDEALIRELVKDTTALNLGGKTTLPELLRLMKKAEFVLSVDTFVSHLAAALDRKTIVIFNELEAVEQWKPWGDSVIVLPMQSNADAVNSRILDLLSRS